MTTSPIRVPRWWLVPVALCALVSVGCSTVGGTASGGDRSPVAPSVIGSPGTLSDQPDVTSADTAADTSTDPGPDRSSSTDAPSDSDDPGVPVSSREPSTRQPTSAPATTAPSTAAPATTAPATTAPNSTTGSPTSTAAAGRTVSISRFASPSRNIGCVIDGGSSVRCDLSETAITEKHDCQGIGDWGHAVVLTRGRPASMQCVSDTVLDASVAVLAYGDSTRVGNITCTSREDGMHCVDDEGHGFRLARASYQVN